MPSITKKRITDDVLNIIEKFSQTDDSRRDPTWIGMKIDEIRAQLIVTEFQTNGQLDRAWLTDLGVKTFHKVNNADDPLVTYCCNDISKLVIPTVVSITSKYDSNIDLGLRIVSACGTKEYSLKDMGTWGDLKDHDVYSKCGFYDRINTALYVKDPHATKDAPTKLRVYGVLASPEDGYIVSSANIASGSIVNGTIYMVKNGTVVYRGVVYYHNDTMTGGATTTFTGNGLVYLKTQVTALAETSDYPCTAEMARQIVLEICTKEFKIESLQIPDKINNSVDDVLAARGTDN